MNDFNWNNLSENDLYKEDLYNMILNCTNISQKVQLEQKLYSVAAKFKIKTAVRQIYESYKKQKEIQKKNEIKQKELEEKQKELEKRNNNTISFGENAPISSLIAPRLLY